MSTVHFIGEVIRVEDFVLTMKKLHGLVEIYDPLIKIS
jgi:hypothetical protein